MYNENRHLILKLVMGVIVLFLIVAAFYDFTPVSQMVEKTVHYENK